MPSPDPAGLLGVGAARLRGLRGLRGRRGLRDRRGAGAGQRAGVFLALAALAIVAYAVALRRS